jgi:hypothetical protein
VKKSKWWWESEHELARAVLQNEKRFTEISILIIILAFRLWKQSSFFAVAFIKPLLIYESNWYPTHRFRNLAFYL